MNIRTHIASMPLVWKMFIFISGLLLFVVGLVEGVLEPLAANMLSGLYDRYRPLHQVALWSISIAIPSLACGYILSKILSRKLDRMARVSKALACGNLNARFPVTGNDRDAFDVLAHNFNDMAEAIENKINNERRLLADISHELRSPLAKMAVIAELLPRRNEEEEKLKLLSRLTKEISNMNDLVALLLTQAKNRFSTCKAMQHIDVKELLQELADDFSLHSEPQDKHITITAQENLNVMGDPLLLRRLFSNILSNALFYTPPKSSIEITAKESSGDIITTIRDYGPGVPDEQLEDVFHAFYRVDNSRARSSGGAGLGLALAREAAIAHNGTVEASNAAPGLMQTITLPEAAHD